MKRKLIAKLLIFICMISTFAGGYAFADEQNPVTLTILCESEEVVLGEMEWKLYKAAERLEEGRYELVGSFSGYEVSLSDSSVSALADAASTLASYVATDTIEADAAVVGDASGKVVFETFENGTALSDGVYLVTADSVVSDGKRYTPAPMLVELASWSDTNAQLTIYPKFTVTDIEDEPVETEYTVTKIWEGENADGDTTRPVAVTVEIYRDGELAETVELNADNDWSYSWTDTEGSQWNVKEAEVPEHYTVVYRADSTDFVIVNTYENEEPEPTPTPTVPAEQTVTPAPTEAPSPTPGLNSGTGSGNGEKLPQTGQLLWPVPILVLAGIVLVALGFRFLKTDEK